MIRVVMVEDSPTQRAVLRRSLEADGDILVVGEAATADGAVSAVRRGQPDVVTVDLHIPGGGERAIEQIMESAPRPILLLSAQLTGLRSQALDAMGAGAAGVLAKPRSGDEAAESALRSRVRSLHGVRPRTRPKHRPPAPASFSPMKVPSRAGTPILAIAASTGGPAAVAVLLRDIGLLPVPVLLVQHIDPALTAGFAEWVGRASGWQTKLAEPGERLRPGVVHVGPGGWHLGVDAGDAVALAAGGDELHRPAADRLFHSLAQHAGSRTVAAILTGMGSDGAAGLLALKDAGAQTFAQDDRTSAVFGMAKAAVEAGAVRRVLPLGALGPAMRRAVQQVGGLR